MTWYALASYKTEQATRPALVIGKQLLDLQDVCAAIPNPGEAVSALAAGGCDQLIRQWLNSAAALNELATTCAQELPSGSLAHAQRDMSQLCQPFQPSQIFAAASNYIEHANEMGTVLAAKADSKPYMFIKALSSTIGPGEQVVIPAQVAKPDWEVELGVVIGKGGRHISVEDSMDHIAGYTILNDVSARDQTRREDYPFKFDWFQGKSFDSFAPIGPWFVPRDCLGDPQLLKLGLDVNDKSMQNGSAEEMIWSIREQISYLSSMLTLQPGDLIATGTPTGVGKGRGIFLEPGDTMRAWVEGIGDLVNPVVAE